MSPFTAGGTGRFGPSFRGAPLLRRRGDARPRVLDRPRRLWQRRSRRGRSDRSLDVGRLYEADRKRVEWFVLKHLQSKQPA